MGALMTNLFIGRRNDSDCMSEGDYGKHNGVWYARPPGGHLGCLSGHEVVEHHHGVAIH